jgi:cytidyltransferase-like protein
MSSKTNSRNKWVVAVSGGFDPIHIGHVRLFHEAKKLGDKLVVILNNDNWARKKKGYAFMPESEREEIIRAFRDVDDVYLTRHPVNPTDMSVCDALRATRPNVFAQGGDRKKGGIPGCEDEVCEEIGCEIVYNVGKGGKVQSSSVLLSNYFSNFSKNFKDTMCPCGSGQKYVDCGLKNTPTHKRLIMEMLNRAPSR